MLNAARQKKVPLVIGSCGGAGGEPHLQQVAKLAREIAREDGLNYKMALIHADQEKSKVGGWLKEGRIRALKNVPVLDSPTVERAARIVGMMGAEPFMRALDDGAEVVLAGRASDAASWAGCSTNSPSPSSSPSYSPASFR